MGPLLLKGFRVRNGDFKFNYSISRTTRELLMEMLSSVPLHSGLKNVRN